MIDYTSKYPNREYTELYYLDTENFSMLKVQAFMCPPNDDDVRWVPEIGISCSVGYSLFEDRKTGLPKLIESAIKEKANLTLRIAKIHNFLMENK